MSHTLRSPGVGPIVGHTTSSSSRIWMRGADKHPGRTVGIAALYDGGGHYVAQSACYFRLHRKHDRTGTVDFAQLRPDTSYRVRVAALALDVEHSSEILADRALFLRLPLPETMRAELEKLPDAECMAGFTTYPTGTGAAVSFIFGSCRYPGLLWPAKKSDRIFAAILGQFNSADAPRFLIMNGDQIYADKLRRWLPFFRADTPAEYRERYVSAFTSPNMRALLRAVPTYMILDDHEIEDDWNVGRMGAKAALFDTAISAYRRYQWLHSPRNYGPAGAVEAGKGSELFYSFECGGYAFFALDSRTQRIQQDGACELADNHMLGAPELSSGSAHRGQINLLCEWLVALQKQAGNRPKFIVSPSTFVPNGIKTAGRDERALRNKCRDDAWAAFPETRRQLLQTIVGHNIQNVVFLCGDTHSSCIAEISFTHKAQGLLPLRALAVTSSAFYWPWPFADGHRDSFVHDSANANDEFAVNAEVVMNYSARAFEQADNFTRIEVTESHIAVQNFDREGSELGSRSVLNLAPL